MYSLFDTIQSHVKNFESQLYTATPAIVESYDPTECTVDVFPAVYKAEVDGQLIKDNLLDRVPVYFPHTSELAITYPIKKGDKVLLVFLQSDSENWFTRLANFVAPRTYRRHSINDPVAFAGIAKYDESPVKSGTEDDLNIYYKDSFTRIQANGDVISSTAGGNVATLFNDGSINLTSPTTVTVDCPNSFFLGNVDVDGLLSTRGFQSDDSIGDGIATFGGTVEANIDVVGAGVSLKDHTHPGDSGGTTGSPN